MQIQSCCEIEKMGPQRWRKHMLDGFQMDLSSEKMTKVGFGGCIVVLVELRLTQSFHCVEVVGAMASCASEVSGAEVVVVAKGPGPAQDVLVEVRHQVLGGNAPKGHLFEEAADKKEAAGRGKHSMELARRVAHVKEEDVVCCSARTASLKAALPFCDEFRAIRRVGLGLFYGIGDTAKPLWPCYCCHHFPSEGRSTVRT